MIKDHLKSTIQLIKENKYIYVIMIYFLLGCETKNAINHNEYKPYVSLDSCVLYYHKFNINKKCYDCIPYAECYISANKKSEIKDIINMKIINNYNNNYDTFNICILDSFKLQYKLCNNLSVSTEICGYYEQLINLYDKIKYGNFHLKYSNDSIFNIKSKSFYIKLISLI